MLLVFQAVPDTRVFLPGADGQPFQPQSGRSVVLYGETQTASPSRARDGPPARGQDTRSQQIENDVGRDAAAAAGGMQIDVAGQTVAGHGACRPGAASETPKAISGEIVNGGGDHAGSLHGVQVGTGNAGIEGEGGRLVSQQSAAKEPINFRVSERTA